MEFPGLEFSNLQRVAQNNRELLRDERRHSRRGRRYLRERWSWTERKTEANPEQYAGCVDSTSTQIREVAAGLAELEYARPYEKSGELALSH